MAVFTPVSLDELFGWITQFDLGQAHAVRGISSGIENSNFFLTTERGEYVLTVFEKLSWTQLPFYLNLMRHLAERGVSVPVPIANRSGSLVSTLRNKPAAIVTKLEGASQMSPCPSHCKAVGTMLAHMHLAALGLGSRQPNPRGLTWWNETASTLLPYLNDGQQILLNGDIALQNAFATSSGYAALPQGIIHADLFRNNVMFHGDQLTGFFDFYFAGCDTWLFDVAVTVNDWCIVPDSGAFDEARLRALLDAYHAVRPFTEDEQAGWQTMLRAAALRFWLSRLYDFHLPREAEMLTPHDPDHFERILRLRIAQPSPALFR